MPKVKVSIAVQGELDPADHADQLRELTALMGPVGLEGWPKDRTAGWRFAARMTGLDILEPVIGPMSGMASVSSENSTEKE